MFIYELKYTWYEDYKPYLFSLGLDATAEEWKNICDSFIEPAFRELKKGRTYEDGSVYFDTIGWDDLTETVAKLMESAGYKRVYPEQSYGYWGSTIGGVGLHFGGEIRLEEQDKILLPDLLKEILDYNIEVNDIHQKQTEELLESLKPMDPEEALDELTKDEEQSE